MILLPMGSALQQIAVRCWGIRFNSSDHAFLHRSQVFSNISKILSRSEELEECTISMHESHQSAINQVLPLHQLFGCFNEMCPGYCICGMPKGVNKLSRNQSI